MSEFGFSGGLRENSDFDASPEECIEGENFLLEFGSKDFRRRPTQDLKGTATPVSTSVSRSVRGLMQLITKSDGVTTLVAASNVDTASSGQVYSWDGASSFSSVGDMHHTSKLRGTHWGLDDFLIITDLSKATVVKKWDATTYTNLTTGLGGALYAKYAHVWNNRVWLFNVKVGASDTPHVILASALENAQNYNSSNQAQAHTSNGFSGNEAFFMVSPDLKPINGVAEISDPSTNQSVLIFSTENGRIFKIIGNDAADYEIVGFYQRSSAVGNESMANIGNDVVYLKSGGVIESISSTERYGDVAANDLSRHVKNTTSGLSDAITIYDQVNQRVLFFITDCVLVYDKDTALTELSPWMKWTTQLTNAFNAQSALYLRRPGQTSWSVYWGDSSGNIYDLNGSGASWDSAAYTIIAYRKLPLLKTIPDALLSGRIAYRRRGECACVIELDWPQEYAIVTCNIPLKGEIVSDGSEFWNDLASPVYWSDAYWNEGGVSEDKLATVGFTPQGRSDGVFITIAINSNVDFLINKMYL